MDNIFVAREQDNVCIIELKDRFDANVAPAVQAWFNERMNEGRFHLVVNLSGVNFIDTRALSILVTGMKRCRQNGGELHLCALQKAVQIIFELSHLHRAFQIFDDAHAAIAAFEGAGKPAAVMNKVIQGVNRESRSLYDSPRVAGA